MGTAAAVGCPAPACSRQCQACGAGSGAESWSRRWPATDASRTPYTRNRPMDMPASDFVHAGSLSELKAKGRLVVHGRHPPILLIYDGGRIFALDNRCPHMGFPLDRGTVEDGILTCHWHHARFD